MAARIAVFRPMGLFAIIRALEVNIDGEAVGRIKVTETCIYEVASGNHEVWVTMDWCQSQPLQVSVQDGETFEIEIVNPAVFGAAAKVKYSPHTLFVLKPKA